MKKPGRPRTHSPEFARAVWDLYIGAGLPKREVARIKKIPEGSVFYLAGLHDATLLEDQRRCGRGS